MHMKKTDKIYVAGHRGLVGSAIVRRLSASGYRNLLCVPSSGLDLRDQQSVEGFFASEKPDHVFLAAAKVGGIHANNTYPAEFIYDNLQIQNNVIESSCRHGVKKLLFLGSSCIYPRNFPQPIKEEFLLSGVLEQTNQWYAVAKIAGIKMCQAYRRQYGFNAVSVMPTNLYGPHDNFDLETSHVMPALIRKFHEAKLHDHESVTVWGSGIPRREFLYVDDLADACLFVMDHYDDEKIINIGSGQEISISGLASLIKDIVGFEGEIVYDCKKPDGTPRKLLDCTRLTNLGWRSRTSLREGISRTYQWFQENVHEGTYSPELSDTDRVIYQPG